MIARLLLLSLLIVGVLITAVATREPAAAPLPEGTDGVKFSHAFHVKQSGMACGDCHRASARTVSDDSLRAGHDQCQSCHEEQLTSKCEFCHTSPDNIAPVVQPVRDLRFSHAQHLGMSDVECATCHGTVAESESVAGMTAPAMESCTTCHNDVRATNQCSSCHVTLAGLKPKDHLEPKFRLEHRRVARLGGLDVSCATCHTQTFCADCHAGTGLVKFGEGDLMTEPSPRGSQHDGPAPTTLQMVHGLNYRFTHGIDAKSRSADCVTCHSTQTFCAECHTAGGVVSPAGAKPAWHLGAGFSTIGVGSGGGRHAEFARRDIESCVSCHDVEGADPTCITCHTDGDGIRGTDPRTHPGGYMKSDHGLWHTEIGAPCYSCHTDANAHPGGTKGRGFCGYCHR